MDSIYSFILGLFDSTYDFLESCTFSFMGFNVNLFGIFLFFIFCSVILSVFWKGGKY